MPISNERQIVRALDQAGDDLDQIRDGHVEAGRLVARAIAAAAPRRTGRLAASFRSTPGRRSVSITSPLIYAPVIEYGWPGHNIAARHFASTAVDRTERQWMQRYERAADRICSTAERVTA